MIRMGVHDRKNTQQLPFLIFSIAIEMGSTANFNAIFSICHIQK